MKKIRLDKRFVDELFLDDNFEDNVQDNIILHLREVFKDLDYEFIADPISPQLSFWFNRHARIHPSKCPEVFFTWEREWPHPGRWDYRFSCAPPSDSNFHIIGAAYVYPEFEEVLSGNFGTRTLERRQTPKTRFCNLVYRWDCYSTSQRVRLYRALSKYKAVDAPGSVCNNMPPIPVSSLVNEGERKASSMFNKFADKMDFIKHYKFTIAAENESAPRYITEKLLQPLAVGSVPIYWGHPCVTEYFNPDSFINCRDFKSLHALVEHVKKVDNDEALYRSYLEAPTILPDSPCHRMGLDSVRKRVKELLDEAVREQGVGVNSKFINRFIRLPLHEIRIKWTERLIRCFPTRFRHLFTMRLRWPD